MRAKHILKNLSLNKRSIIYGISAISAIFISFYLLHLNNHQQENFASKLPITTPWRQSLNIKKEYVAQIKAVQHIELRSLEKGYLQNIYVDEGQFVRKGQKMFQIMPLLLEADLKKTKAEYQLAKIEYDNTLILQKKNVVSKNELALAKARLDKAHAEMDVSRTHLDFSTIKAPFSGIMDRFYVRLGSLVNEGDLLTTISDNSKMWVYFNISESDYLDYMQNKDKDKESELELTLANGTLYEQKGKIDTIEADFNNEVGNVAFRATFPNPNRLLRHGETGTILLSKKFNNSLVIPQKATFEVLDKKFVYVVDENNKIISKQINVIDEVPHLFIISSGVSENDKILLEGLGKVKIGETIQTQYLDHEVVRNNLELSTK